ncbi:amidohydrolase family protein [Neoroseomonas rubea]|uniref:amidohydrolase family protein n=1 Tax=Neoroseomonas rubea TaxID=2748666 RepID=UPI0018DFA18C|nr:amidohydrolase family protein [Roseomonas rubea]
MATLIHDTTIVTVDDADTVHHDASIAIEGGRIAAIGANDALRARFPDAERIDGRNRMVMPGFANIHTHLGMTLARGIFEDLSPPHAPPFCGGLSPLPLPPLSREETGVMVQLGALEALRSGTTALLEDGAGIAGYAGLLETTGLRLLLAERAWDRAKAGIGDPGPFEVSERLGDEGMERIARLHAEWNGKAGGRIKVGVAAWAPDMCTPGMLKRLRGLQQSLDCVCTVHLNQIWGEVAAVQAHRGMLPTEYLHAEGFVSDRMVAAHCRCMAHREERLLGQARARVSFNSAIAARRGLSPRIQVLEAEGCTIGMGTDNMAEDMVEVMRTGLFMERIRREDGRSPTPEHALRWATRNGYAAMEVPDGGWLAQGNRADLIMVRTDRAHLVPRMRPVSGFVHQGQAADVVDVMVDGAWLMRDGRVLSMDEEVIVAEADRIARRAWAKMFADNPGLEVPRGFAPPA